MPAEFEKKTALLVLEDGTVCKGFAAGKIGTATGEICFNTGMTGYQEIFTDPSYFGQILVTTNAHIGNYGIKYIENEASSIRINALVCKNFTNQYSRLVADSSIQDYLLDQNLVAIYGIDTRFLVKHIRDKGAMNAIVSSEILDEEELKQKLKDIPSMKGLELSTEVTTNEVYYLGSPSAKHRVAVLDLGVKANILRHLVNRDCYLKVYPAKTPFSEMESWNPDGYFVSNGPGDPAAMPYAVETVKNIVESNNPMFGICLGHQIFALSMEIPTFKLHIGHRGLNHPVKNLITGKCEITSQNHGFGVVSEALQGHKFLEVTHVNLNDNSVEGIRHKDKKAFSVQFHPETAPGPHDSEYLFDDFINLMNHNI